MRAGGAHACGCGVLPASAITIRTQIGSFPCGCKRRRLAQVPARRPDRQFDDASRRLAAGAEGMIVLANPVQPHSEGEIVIESADPAAQPSIRISDLTRPR